MPEDNREWEGLAIDAWLFIWNQPPGRLVEGAFVVPFVGTIGLGIIMMLASIADALFKLLLLYGGALVVLAFAKLVHVRRQRQKRRLRPPHRLTSQNGFHESHGPMPTFSDLEPFE